jgi:hypothetical protein
MNEENQINDKLKIKRKLTNVLLKKYRRKTCTESQQPNSLMQDDPTEEIQHKQVKKTMSNEREQWQRNVREGSSCSYSYSSIICPSMVS